MANTDPNAPRSCGKITVAPICCNILEDSWGIIAGDSLVTISDIARAANAPPPSPTRPPNGVNWAIAKATIPIDKAGKNIRFPNFAACFSLNSSLLFASEPIFIFLVAVINPITRREAPTITGFIYGPNINTSPKIIQNAALPILLSFFWSLKAYIPHSIEITPQITYIISKIKFIVSFI